MAKKKADQKQKQKTTVKEGKKHKMNATADNGSKKRQENP